MADPIELQIVQAIRSRLANISVANGYHTDAGANVCLGRVLDEAVDEFPALVVWLVEPNAPGDTRAGNVRRSLPVLVEGYVRVEEDDPLEATLKLARDIKAAVYQLDDLVLVEGAGVGDLELGADEHFPPDPGSDIATAQVTLSVPYVEKFTG